MIGYLTDILQEDEADYTIEGLFVMGHHLEQALRRQTGIRCRQPQCLDQRTQAGTHSSATKTQTLRQNRHQRHTHGDRLAMGVLRVHRGGFQGMPQRMAKIENGTPPPFGGILLHHAYFDRNRPLNERGEDGFFALAYRLNVLLNKLKQLWIANHTSLDDLA